MSQVFEMNLLGLSLWRTLKIWGYHEMECYYKKYLNIWKWLWNAWASPVAQMVTIQPAMQETWVSYLDWEDPLEKRMATHSSILAWRIPWAEESRRI